jgi:hypothetical protein
LNAIYPEHKWNHFDFNLSKGYWKSKINQKIFLDKLAEEMNLKTSLDWKRITSQQIKDKGGHSLLMYYNSSLSQILKSIYPEKGIKIFIFSTNVYRMEFFISSFRKSNAF